MKTKILKLATLLGAAALALSFNGPAAAGTNTATFTVTASVAANCTISASGIAFGTYDPIGVNATTNLLGSGTLTVNCTPGTTTADISLDNGLHSSAGTPATRRMSDGSATPNYMSYDLFLPTSAASAAACAYTTEWGSTSGTDTLAPSGAWTGSSQSFNVCGSVPSAQTPPAGSYSDTITATVTF